MKKLKIMIVEYEGDILILYKDCLTSKGHQVVNKYLSADCIMTDTEKESPDV